MAELVLTLVFLWVGARGVEFNWCYIQKSLYANILLVHCITLACLIWIWSRKESTQSTGAAAVLLFVLDLACYKGVIVAAVAQFLRLASWVTLLQNVGLTSCLGEVTL
jgi:hypothetical protein